MSLQLWLSASSPISLSVHRRSSCKCWSFLPLSSSAQVSCKCVTKSPSSVVLSSIPAGGSWRTHLLLTVDIEDYGSWKSFLSSLIFTYISSMVHCYGVVAVGHLLYSFRGMECIGPSSSSSSSMAVRLKLPLLGLSTINGVRSLNPFLFSGSVREWEKWWDLIKLKKKKIKF